MACQFAADEPVSRAEGDAADPERAGWQCYRPERERDHKIEGEGIPSIPETKINIDLLPVLLNKGEAQP